MPRVVRHAVIQPADTSIKLIPLTQGQNAIVDVEDFEELSKHEWYAQWSPGMKNFYAVRSFNANNKKIVIRMHRVLLQLDQEDPLQGDHANRNTLDNRKKNLRQASCGQNTYNRKIRSDNIYGYKGIVWRKDKNKWAAQYRINGQRRHVGYFFTKEDAAQAYALAAYLAFGEFYRVI